MLIACLSCGNPTTAVSMIYLGRIIDKSDYCQVVHTADADKTRLSCIVRVGSVNWSGNKTRQFSVVLNMLKTEQLQNGSWVQTRQNSVHTAFRDKTKLSCLVASSVHTADTYETKQDSFVLSVSVVWTRHKAKLAGCTKAISDIQLWNENWNEWHWWASQPWHWDLQANSAMSELLTVYNWQHVRVKLLTMYIQTSAASYTSNCKKNWRSYR